MSPSENIPDRVSPDDCLDTVVESLESTVIERFDLHPAPMDGSLSHGLGSWGLQSILLSSRFLQGESEVARLHVARGTGQDECFSSLTVLGLPTPNLAAPIFALDAVAFRDRFAIVALDLAPTVPLPASPSPELESSKQLLEQSGEVRSVPQFLEGLHSDCFALVRGGPETANVLASAALGYIAEWKRSIDVAPQCTPDQCAPLQRRYLQAMHENKRETKALAALFGESWSSRFLSEGFFNPEVVAQAMSHCPVGSR